VKVAVSEFECENVFERVKVSVLPVLVSEADAVTVSVWEEVVL
jgi:hypothetical protein